MDKDEEKVACIEAALVVARTKLIGEDEMERFHDLQKFMVKMMEHPSDYRGSLILNLCVELEILGQAPPVSSKPSANNTIPAASTMSPPSQRPKHKIRIAKTRAVKGDVKSWKYSAENITPDHKKLLPVLVSTVAPQAVDPAPALPNTSTQVEEHAHRRQSGRLIERNKKGLKEEAVASSESPRPQKKAKRAREAPIRRSPTKKEQEAQIDLPLSAIMDQVDQTTQSPARDQLLAKHNTEAARAGILGGRIPFGESVPKRVEKARLAALESGEVQASEGLRRYVGTLVAQESQRPFADKAGLQGNELEEAKH